MSLIIFHSPKGGVGNSFLVAQVAMEMASRGFEAVAIDFTYQNSLKLFFSLLPDQEIVHLDDDDRDEIVVSGVELFDGHRLAQREAFRDFLAEPSAKPFPPEKVVIADVASGDLWLRDLLLPHADLHVCTIDARPVSLASLRRADHDLPLVDLSTTALVVNMIDETRDLSRHCGAFVRSALGSMLLGMVRHDESVSVALATFEHLGTAFPQSAVIADIRKLTDDIVAKCSLATNPVERAP